MNNMNCYKHFRWLSPFTLILFFLVTSVQLPAQDQSISWNIGDDEYMVYRSDTDYIDPFGYEVKGNLPSPRFVTGPEKVPFFLSMILPNKRIGVDGTYKFLRRAPKFNPLVPGKIAVKGTRKSDKTVDGKKLVHLKHSIKVVRKPDNVHPNWKGSFCRKGTLEVDIYYDPEPGLIRNVSWESDLKFEPNKSNSGSTSQSVTGNKSYTLERHHPAGTNNFQKRVSDAIEKGVKSLSGRVDGGDQWDLNSNCHAADCPKGKAALVLLALLESDEVSKKSKIVKQGMNFLFGKTDFRKVGGGILDGSNGKNKQLVKDYNATYQEGLRLMVMEAFYQSKLIENMMKRRRQGKSVPDQFKNPKKDLHPADADWVLGALQWFLKYHNNGGMHYGANTGNFDNSNTQYAALGVYAAMNLQVPIKNPSSLKKMLSHWLRTQQKEGPTVHLKVGNLGSDSTSVVRNVSAKGWSYRSSPGPNEFYGKFGGPRMAMTAGAVGSIKILRAYLKRLGALDRKLKKASQKALTEGLAWLNANWQLRPYPTGAGKYYYMMYAVERAAMLNSLSTIGNHKWYPEGAELLLTRLNDWAGNPVKASFAILFLKRATNPIVTTGN